MIAALIGAAARGAGAGAGFGYLNRRMTPPSQAPIWTGVVDGTTLTLMQNTVRGRMWFELFAVLPGAWHSVGSYAMYPAALSAVQTWTRFLEGGGSVEAWQRSAISA
jgi:hypothetical protein